tara:strand:+ start:236 stop:934 length:699 start_codon:yes stop_codon:yes gene_type:complete
MADEITEYTVRDYSAVDKQIDEIARRERILTNRLNLENLKRFILIGLMVVGGICLLVLALAIAYRIAFPPEKKVLENPLPVEVTVKNEPIILKENTNTTVNKNVPSNKIFGIPETNTNTTKYTNTENKNIIQNEERKKSKLDNTTVVTFKKQSSNLTGFREVTTGWRWKNPDADKPFNQYCYVTNINNVVIDLANNKNNTKLSLYDYYTANRNNLTKNQWNNLESKCQWYSN